VGNQTMRGVSGGERKRVSIGVELLTDPSILFMDEPTSGLDSTTALKLSFTMRDLAREGRTIVASIHQPSSRLFQNMDKLILLADGHVIFNDNTSNIMEWLSKTMNDLPLGSSISEHILDLASGETVGDTGDKTGTDKLIEFFRGEKKGEESTDRTGPISDIEESVKEGKHDDTIRWFDQVKILSTRAVRTRRFTALSTQRIVEIVLVAVLSGLFWFQVGDELLTPAIVIDLSGLLFFQILFLSFSALFQALLTFPMEFQILKKERQSDLYMLSAYYIARTISDFPMDSLIPSVFCWIVYWMSGLRISAPAFFQNWFSSLLIMFVAQSIGLLIGAMIQNFRTALSFTTVLVLSIMLVGGFYVRNIPVWIRWARYLSFIYYGYGQVLKIEFNHRLVTCDDQSGKGLCPISETDILDVDVDTSFALQSCMLIAFLLLTRIGIFYALQFKLMV